MSDDPTPAPGPRLGRVRAVLGWLRRNAYLGLAAAAVLLVTKVVDFAPPPEVRIGRTGVAQLVGDAPPQEFSHQLSNPQAVQVRATLRLYADNELAVSAPDPQTDAQGKLLSQPVVTTILGMNAAMQQTVRLESGDLEVDVSLDATPRLGQAAGKGPAPIILEHALEVASRRSEWWRRALLRRVHLSAHGFLHKVEDGGYRVVFSVDRHLFSLDLELRRADPLVVSTAAAETFANAQ